MSYMLPSSGHFATLRLMEENTVYKWLCFGVGCQPK